VEWVANRVVKGVSMTLFPNNCPAPISLVSRVFSVDHRDRWEVALYAWGQLFSLYK
jgi:hypothetical protein